MASRMARWFNELVEVYRKEAHEDWEAEPYLLNGTIKCFIQPITGRMATVRGKVSDGAAYRLFCPIGSDVDIGDRIIDSNKVQYIVLFVPPDSGISGVKDHLEIDLEVE